MQIETKPNSEYDRLLKSKFEDMERSIKTKGGIELSTASCIQFGRKFIQQSDPDYGKAFVATRLEIEQKVLEILQEQKIEKESNINCKKETKLEMLRKKFANESKSTLPKKVTSVLGNQSEK